MSNKLAESADIQLNDGTLAIVRSEASRKLVSMIYRVAPHPTSVLITGETGSGKELIARAIHMFSLRNNKPWIDVNCAALPEHLIESELFGYEKGAFSGADSMKPGFFELADQGTLFLDEIGELESRLQVKLLRVLDGAPYYRLGGNKKISVNVRVIAATNRDLEEEVRAGKFRRDLYHRLCQVLLRVPPLRHRQEDIEGIATHFLREQREDAAFSPEAVQLLRSYTWPGNVRELKNVVRNAAVMLEGDRALIDAKDLPQEIAASSFNAEEAPIVTGGDLDEMERQMILKALDRSGGDQTKASEQLGISRRTLSRKLKAYRIIGALPSIGQALGALSVSQQQYFRALLEVPVRIKPASAPVGIVHSINVSARGIGVDGIHMSGVVDTELELEFKLPPDDVMIKAKAKLSWMDARGRGGIKFLSVDQEEVLHSWLQQQIEKEGWAKLI